MQPYFIPYPGYFRLFVQTDTFVIYDCVQFPRRGFVHRNRYPTSGGENWLTLPLQKSSRNTTIGEMKFRNDAGSVMSNQINRLLENTKNLTVDESLRRLIHSLSDVSGSLCDYLERTLLLLLSHLKIPSPKIIRSSELDIPNTLSGQDRILAICEALGATEYINSPGGKALYDETLFAEQGITLNFLSDYSGEPWSVLFQLLSGRGEELRELVVEELLLE